MIDKTRLYYLLVYKHVFLLFYLIISIINSNVFYCPFRYLFADEKVVIFCPETPQVPIPTRP